MAACVAANGVPFLDPLKPMPPALDHAITCPSASVMVTMVLLNDAWMWAKPWCTTRFSPRFLNVFFFLPAAFPVSGVAPGAPSGVGVLAIVLLCQLLLVARGAPPPLARVAALALLARSF